MGDVSIPQIVLISIAVQTFLLGVFTTLFAATVRLILTKRISNPKAVSLVLPTTTIIWLFAVAHWVIDMARLQIGFLHHQQDLSRYFVDLATPYSVAKIALYVTATLIGDCFMIYRCWIIWTKSYAIIAFPTLLWLACWVSGYGGTHALLSTLPGEYLKMMAAWITTFIVSTLATNAFCTLSIAYRILRSQSAVRSMQTGKSHLVSIVIVFLESAALYSANLGALLITYELNSRVQFVLVDSTCAVVGITFSMIILPIARSDAETTCVSTRVASHRPEGVNVSRLVEVTTDREFELDTLHGLKHKPGHV